MKKKSILTKEILLDLSWPAQYTLRFILEINKPNEFDIKDLINIATSYDSNSNPSQSLHNGLRDIYVHSPRLQYL